MWPQLKDLWAFAAIGVGGVYLGQLFLLIAMTYISAFNAMVLDALIPVFTLLLGHAFGVERLRLWADSPRHRRQAAEAPHRRPLPILGYMNPVRHCTLCEGALSHLALLPPAIGEASNARSDAADDTEHVQNATAVGTEVWLGNYFRDGSWDVCATGGSPDKDVSRSGCPARLYTTTVSRSTIPSTIHCLYSFRVVVGDEAGRKRKKRRDFDVAAIGTLSSCFSLD